MLVFSGCTSRLDVFLYSICDLFFLLIKKRLRYTCFPRIMKRWILAIHLVFSSNCRADSTLLNMGKAMEMERLQNASFTSSATVGSKLSSINHQHSLKFTLHSSFFLVAFAKTSVMLIGRCEDGIGRKLQQLLRGVILPVEAMASTASL